MITPSQIRERKISTVESGGYDRVEVNELLVEVIDSYEAIFNENKELYRKMDILASRIEEYRADEDSIKKALITAQKMADSVTESANAEAEKTLAESRESAHRTVVDAQEKADGIIAEARTYVANLTKEKTDAANEIVVEAEKKANEAIEGSKLVAQNALAQAKKLSLKIVSDSKNESEYYSSMVEKLKNEAMQFRASLVTLYEAQLAKLAEFESFKADTSNEEEGIEVIEAELNRVIEGIDEIVNKPVAAEEPEEEKEEETAEDTAEEAEAEPELVKETIPFDDGEEEEIEEIEEIEELEEEEDTYDVEEIIDELEERHEADEAPTPEEIQNAINSFSTNEITPLDEDAINPIPVIEDEPEFESPQPFESYFDTSKGHQHTDEKISLISPEEDDDDDEDFSKFKGFFKKKK